MDWNVVAAGLLRLAEALREVLRALRGRRVRDRARTDGAGLLMEQFGRTADAAGTDKSAETDSRRDAGRRAVWIYDVTGEDGR